MAGTRITFIPDKTIFETTEFDYYILAHRLRELAFLNAGLTIMISDQRTGDYSTYCYAGGLSEFVKYLNEGAECLNPVPIFIARKDVENKVELEVAMQYHDGYNLTMLAFSNNIHQPDGGTHVSGYNPALTRVINSYARKMGFLKEKATNFTSDDVSDVLTVVIFLLKLFNKWTDQIFTPS